MEQEEGAPETNTKSCRNCGMPATEMYHSQTFTSMNVYDHYFCKFKCQKDWEWEELWKIAEEEGKDK